MWPFTKRKASTRRYQPLSQEELLKLSIQEKLKSYSAGGRGRARFSGPAPLYDNDMLSYASDVFPASRMEFELVELDDVAH
ncbi:MAG: hypothetical protein P8104_06790 [Gammaproteobacteria bacterium]|jgi:hypothetical protein